MISRITQIFKQKNQLCSNFSFHLNEQRGRSYFTKSKRSAFPLASSTALKSISYRNNRKVFQFNRNASNINTKEILLRMREGTENPSGNRHKISMLRSVKSFPSSPLGRSPTGSPSQTFDISPSQSILGSPSQSLLGSPSQSKNASPNQSKLGSPSNSLLGSRSQSINATPNKNKFVSPNRRPTAHAKIGKFIFPKIKG